MTLDVSIANSRSAEREKIGEFGGGGVCVGHG